MNKGALIFAHNSRDVDYILMAVVSGALAKKNLDIPVSLVTDKSTVEWFRSSEHSDLLKIVFEHVIIVDKPVTNNRRKLRDGTTYKTVPFINANRSTAFDVTPYENTLIIDSDYLVFSNNLSNYWDLEYDVMIGNSMNDIRGNRSEILDRQVSEVGPPLYWATTLMFKKTNYSKVFFNLVSFIKDNYEYYADLYRFDHRQFRNDIAFSIAKHILHAHESDNFGTLPSIRTVFDNDILYSVSETGVLQFLISDRHNPQEFTLASTNGVDVHILNKQSIVRHSKDLLKLL